MTPYTDAITDFTKALSLRSADTRLDITLPHTEYDDFMEECAELRALSLVPLENQAGGLMVLNTPYCEVWVWRSTRGAADRSFDQAPPEPFPES